MRISVFLFFSLVLNVGAGPGGQLRKIKNRLTGTDPTYGEYVEFQLRLERECGQDVESSCLIPIFRDYVRRYMDSGAFLGRVIDFVGETLWLKPYIQWDFPLLEERESFPRDTLTNLVLDIFRHNLSWDHFFTASSFRQGGEPGPTLPAYPSVTTMVNDPGGEYAHFADHLLEGEGPPEREDRYNSLWPFRARVENSDLAAGFALTGRFNERFFDSLVNRGRRRAQAMIRIGLCDALNAEADFNASSKNEQVLLALGLLGQKNYGDGEEEHGTNPQCRHCHEGRGLDPLAKTFGATELVIGKSPTPGRFVYRTDEGNVFDQPVRGIGHWMRVLITRPEYARCQVARFWDFFVGDSNDLKENRALGEKILEAFESRGRRVLDFVEYLVLSPEFLGSHSPEENEGLTLRESLAPCRSCHREDFAEANPTLLLEKLALGPYENLSPSMPPPSAGWVLGPEGRETVLRWAQGESEGGGEGNLFFRKNHRRARASKDLIRFLWAKFDTPGPHTPRACLWNSVVPGRNYILAGGFLPVKGRALVGEVGEDFVLTYLSCVRQFARAKVRRLSNATAETLNYLGPSLEEWFESLPVGEGHTLVRLPRWQDIPEDNRREGLLHWVRTLVGPAYIQEELHFIGPDSKVRGRPSSEGELVDILDSIRELHRTDILLDEAFSAVALRLFSVEDMIFH